MAKKKVEEINNIQVFDEPNQITQDSVSQDEVTKVYTDDVLLFYVKELLVSLEGVFIGGYASQKRDQLIEYLNKR
jgi:hypothetical protein